MTDTRVSRVPHPADVRTCMSVTTRHVPCAGDTCPHDASECPQCSPASVTPDSVRSHHRILNPFFRFIHRFSGRRRLRGNSQESLCDDNTVSDTWAMTREEAVTGCDPTRDTQAGPPGSWSAASPSPSPPFLSPGLRSPGPGPHHSQSRLCLLYLVLVTLISCADACSSRSTPRPRPPSPTMRPNITFQTYACPPAYAAWYCLNGATCFTVKIDRSILYNCECSDGFMGQRCEFKDLDGTYVSSSERLKQAAAASLSSVVSASSNVMVGALIIILATALAALAFTKRRSRAKMRKIEETRQQTLEGQTPEISVDSGHSFSHTTPSLNLSSDSCCAQHPDVSFTESETSFQDSDPSLRSWCHELPLSSLPQKLPKESCVYQKSESLYQLPSSRLPMSVSGSWRPSPASADGSVMEGTISFAMSRQDHNTRQIPNTAQAECRESEV